MKNGSDTWHWPRFIRDIVDLLIGACVLFVAYATFNAAADYLDLLVAGVIALVGIGLMLEPNATAQASHEAAPQMPSSTTRTAEST